MPFYLLHAGTTLQKMSTGGTIQSLTPPGTVTISGTRKARTAILGRRLFICHAPSRNLMLDPATMTLYEINLTAPVAAPTIAAGVAGLPKGTYRYRVAYCSKVSDAIVAMSAMSPVAGPLSVTNQRVELSVIPTSVGYYRRIFRTLTNGEQYYAIADLDDDVTTTYSDNFADYDLQLLDAVDLSGTPPGSSDADYFKLCVTWKDRIWAIGNAEPDNLRFSEVGAMYQWPESNYLAIRPIGADTIGVTALLNRRDELGVAKRRSLWKVIGTYPWEVIQVDQGVGCVSQDSVVVIRDRAFFLFEDGVYSWGSEGVQCISRKKVHPWFTTDDYFNRSLFSSAFAKWNQKYDTYELHLAAAGSVNIDRWVSYDIQRGVWLGPHKTSAFTPSCAAAVEDENTVLWPVMGGTDGYVYKQNASVHSDNGLAIDMDLIPGFHDGGDPDLTHFWGHLTMLTKVETSGTLTITTKVGGLDAGDQAPISHDLTKGRERLRRLGVGRLMQLRMQNSEVGQSVEIYGYEIPVFPIGRR